MNATTRAGNHAVAKNATLPANVAEVAAAAPNDGGPALLDLWLLLTTNPTFLLNPAAAAVTTDVAAGNRLGTTTVQLTPGPADQIGDWAKHRIN